MDDKRIWIGMILVSVLLLNVMFLNACGPSEEAIATMTASAWTPTPEPTLTPTPVPIDMEIALVDAQGKPFTMAYVMVNEIDMIPKLVDDQGKISFSNLSAQTVHLVINAQGYLPLEKEENLERGENTISIVIEEVDPDAILPEEACAPGQDVLYIEDFEDGEMQGWENINKPFWEFTDIDGNTVLSARLIPNQYTNSSFTGHTFGSSVYHFDILRPAEFARMSFYKNKTNDDNSYIFGMTSVDSGTGISHQAANPDEMYPVAQKEMFRATAGERWETFSFADFEGILTVWVDDELLLIGGDPNPYPEGEMWMEFTSEVDALVQMDNLVICGLTAEYEPYIPEEAPQE
jgi:hypothetical protein